MPQYAGMGHQIPEPVSPMVPADDPYMPAAQPAAATAAAYGAVDQYGQQAYASDPYAVSEYGEGYSPQQYSQQVAVDANGMTAQYGQDSYAQTS